MNLFSFFKKKSNVSTEADQKWLRGNQSFEIGKKHFLARRDQEAVDCFDTAIKCGFENAELFGLRGSCLQSLNWHLDAIDDFTKAISSESQDCNLYFQRAMSKSSIGDEQGFLADIQDAIRLSKKDNAINRSYNLGAKEMGWQSTAAMYEAQIALSPWPDFIKDKKIMETKLRGRRHDQS